MAASGRFLGGMRQMLKHLSRWGYPGYQRFLSRPLVEQSPLAPRVRSGMINSKSAAPVTSLHTKAGRKTASQVIRVTSHHAKAWYGKLQITRLRSLRTKAGWWTTNHATLVTSNHGKAGYGELQIMPFQLLRTVLKRDKEKQDFKTIIITRLTRVIQRSVDI